ncbi:MAG: YfiM family protein [Bacteroidia bacterium]|nr:YfiM family protein [Bacteroidia bacterium]
MQPRLSLITKLLLLSALTYADTTRLPKRFWIGTALSYAGVYGVPMFLWYDWSTARGWRFFDDGGEWKQMDKLGHVWTTYHLSWIYRTWAESCGYPSDKARILAALLAWSFQNSIEIADGFFPKWGASFWDVVANTMGTGLFWIADYLRPWRIDVRFSFFPSPYAAQRPDLLGRGLAQILKDYNGQTYWLVIMHASLPVGIAIGHGARGLLGGYGREPKSLIEAREYRRWLLSLDPHWEVLIRRSRWAMSIFVAIKTPFPALVYERSALRVAWIYF